MLPKRPSFPILLSIFFLGIAGASPALAVDKTPVVPMSDHFQEEAPLIDVPGRFSVAAAETTIRHKVFFSDLDGSTAGWDVINFRAGQPVAWNIVSGAHACVGSSWWMGQTGFTYGDGYDNNWIQSLTTNVPIDLAGTTNNKLNFKMRLQTEYTWDWGIVLIRGSGSALWDTLATYTGNFGASCVNQSLSIPDSFTTVAQPVAIQFLFGSDLTISTADDNAAPYTGWTLDDIEVKAQGNPPGGAVRFFDDMESGSAKWVTSSPDPGSLWHVENSPTTSNPASCFFLSTDVFVPFDGFGFGIVPNYADAMLTTPPMNIEGVFSPATATTVLKLQFDDWENFPAETFLRWSLWIRGSDDQVTWTSWHNATGFSYEGGNPQCKEVVSVNFNPYNTVQTGILAGTPWIQLGFRLRDEKASGQGILDGSPLSIGYNTEGIYFDNVGVFYVYTIAGAEAIGGVPAGNKVAIRRAYPNPFNPSTTIEFSVPKQGPAVVRIVDLRGRQVATLVDGSMPAGEYRVRWDGRDGSGRDVSSGVYFAMIQSAGGRDAVRLTLLK